MPKLEVEIKRCIGVNQDTEKAGMGKEVKVEIDEASDADIMVMLSTLIRSLHTDCNIPELALFVAFKTAFDPTFQPETIADSEQTVN